MQVLITFGPSAPLIAVWLWGTTEPIRRKARRS
jgi:hypothetical protein